MSSSRGSAGTPHGRVDSLLFPPGTPLSTRLARVPLPPVPVTPGRPGLDRVLDLVTEHETHYRQQARARKCRSSTATCWAGLG
jgi:hypothetical protein